jgi:hypothetical protein
MTMHSQENYVHGEGEEGPPRDPMLGKIISVLISILCVAQGIVFFGWKWVSVKFGLFIKFGLNPAVVWLLVGLLGFFLVWWLTYRKWVPRWQKFLVLVSTAVSIAVAVIGLSLDPPSTIESPSVPGDENDNRKLLLAPPRDNPYLYRGF